MNFYNSIKLSLFLIFILKTCSSPAVYIVPPIVDGNTEEPAKVVNNETKIKLNTKQNLVMKQVLEVYVVKTNNNSCKNHSMEYANALKRFESWAINMFDASSKIQPGILNGNLFEFGNYKQCVSIQQYLQHGERINGKFCTLKIYPDDNLLKKILSFRNVSDKRWNKTKIFVKNASLDWSVCVPDSCHVNDILLHYEKLIYSLTEGLNLTVRLEEINCLTAENGNHLNQTETIIIAIFILYIILIIVFTITDFCSSNIQVGRNQLLRIFSTRQHARHIFARSVKDPSTLECVHGLRFLSTCYVIIGHRYLMMMFFPVINSLRIMDWILLIHSTTITGGTLCVDTFFILSGMLVSIAYFERRPRKGSEWAMFYIYRYLRITPQLGIVVLWYATLMQYCGSGPLWNDMLEIVQKPCKEYWWATILHIQNYINPFPLCMTQAWYLTCDMQYYIFSPIILVPLSNNVTLGMINLFVIYLISVVTNFYFAYIHKYNGGVPITNHLFATKYFRHHYIIPHIRASTYILGLALGFCLQKYKGRSMRISQTFAIFCWICCVFSMLASLAGCLVFFLENHDYNRIESSIFLAVSRSSWSLGIIWIIWACANGYGGPVNYILSLHIFRVLGKISYSMYLLHMGVQYMMSGAAKIPGYFSDLNSIFAAFGDIFMMLILGFLFTICFESPVIQALSLMLKKKKPKQPIKIYPEKYPNKIIY